VTHGNFLQSGGAASHGTRSCFLLIHDQKRSGFAGRF
jgi:hypothetical protein